MTSKPKFSRPGAAPTAFERELLERQATGSGTVIALAKALGAERFAQLLDHIGGQKTYLPARGNFFMELYLDERNAEIRRRVASGKESPAQIAKDHGLSRSQVCRIAPLGTARTGKS